MLPLPHSITCIFLIVAHLSLAQQDSTANSKRSLLLYPVGFYTPETGIGGGFASSFNFFTKKENPKESASNIQLGIAYTERKQLGIYLPFDIYFNERKNQISGEIGYYDYVFYYFGVVGSKAVPREYFFSRTPRFRGQYTRKLYKNFFAGFKGWFDDFRIYDYSENSELRRSNRNDKLGGVGVGPGVFFLFDTRNHVAVPDSGWYIEPSFHHYTNIFERSFGFDRYRIDVRYYHAIGKAVLANQFFSETLTGDVPFFQMTGLGGNRRFRGYWEGQYRGRSLILLQSEWRHFPFERWGYTIFGGIANVGNKNSPLFSERNQKAFGFGIRYKFDIQKRVHLRLDAAFGETSPTIYFTIGEAF